LENPETRRKKLLSHEAQERIYQGLAITRLPRFLNRTIFRKAHTIITYHGVREKNLSIDDECFIARDRFVRQMLYVKRHFTVVPLSQALEQAASPETRKLPLLSITFDDGFQNVHDIAFPILLDLGLPATVFLVTGLTDTDETIWYCALNQAFSETGKKSIVWRDRRYDLTNLNDRAHACLALQGMLKKMPHDILVQEVESILSSLGYRFPLKISSDSPFRILNSSDIQKMHKSGLVEFGAHTHTHSILSLLPDRMQEFEIRSSIDCVKGIVGRECTLFSYPNGEEGDFEEKTRELLIRNNILCSVTMMRGPNYPDTDPLCYRRYGIENAMSDYRFMMNVHHMVWVKRSISRMHRRGSDQECPPCC
jgi:peptidoglycan/xylan/chitin deacetylase (PgdA/CDA1 family)